MRIDLRKSIDKGRLVESDISNETRGYILLSYFFGAILAFVPLYLAMSVLVSSRTMLTLGPILIVLLFLTIGLVALYGLLFKDKLLRINGSTDKNVNKSLMKVALKEVFRRNTFLDTGNIWSSRRFDKISIMGKRYNRLTIIFDNDSIYCNGALIVRDDLQSTLHSWFYLLKFIIVRKTFRSKLDELHRQKSNYA